MTSTPEAATIAAALKMISTNSDRQLRACSPPPRSSSPLDAARHEFLRARHHLTIAALDELVRMVRELHPEAVLVVVGIDEIDECFYLAGVHDRTGEPVTLDVRLSDRPLRRVLSSWHPADLAVLASVAHDPAALAFRLDLATCPA